MAWGAFEKQDQCPDPIGALRRPSAAIGGLWVGVKVRTGLPPQTPPDFYSSKVEVVGDVGVVLTRRRESADPLL